MTDASIEASALGLDLGTLQARVAVIRGGARAELVADADGHHSVPSVVGYYADEAPLVGIEAQRKKARALPSTLTHLKALLSLAPDAAAAVLTREEWFLGCVFKAQPSKGGSVEFSVDSQGHEQRVRPEEALSLLIKSLHVTASPYLDSARALTAAVAVPDDLSESARVLLLSSARAALPLGSRVSLVSDAQCVAIANGLTDPSASSSSLHTQRVCVVDFGSVLRVSELNVQRGIVHVVRSIQVEEVRACHIEKALMEHWASEASKKLRVDASTILSAARSRAKLSAECARVLRVLGNASECAVHVEALIDGLDFSSSLTRAKCDALCERVWRAAAHSLRSFVQSSLSLSQSPFFDRVLLSGGHSKLPRMNALITSVFDSATLSSDLDPLTVVAMGAALHARSLLRMTSSDPKDPKTPNLSLLRREVSATTRAIGVRVSGRGGVAQTLVPRDSPLPLLRRVRLRLKAETKSEAKSAPRSLEIVEGEYYEPSDDQEHLEEEEEGELEGEGADQGEAESEDTSYERLLVRVKVSPSARVIDLTIRLDEHAHLSVRVQHDGEPSVSLAVPKETVRVSEAEARTLRSALFGQDDDLAEK